MVKRITQTQFFSTIITVCLVICIFIAPSNLFLKFDQFNWAVRGLRIDYLLPKLYLSDITGIILLLSLWARSIFQIKKDFSQKNLWPLAAVFILWSGFIARQFFTPFPVVAVATAVRLGLFVLLWWLLQKQLRFVQPHWLWWTTIASIFFQTVLGITQFISQKSMGSYQWLLGESNLTQTPGIALASFGSWGEKILPYGTTAHPNILAGWVTGSWLLALYWQGEKPSQQRWAQLALLFGGVLCLIIIYLTQSWSALGLSLVGLAYYVMGKKFLLSEKATKLAVAITALCLCLSPWWMQTIDRLTLINVATHETLSWQRRSELNESAMKLWQTNQWLGVGAGQFTAKLETVELQKELVRFVQPVHHQAWLWLSETGLFGLFLVIVTTYLAATRSQRFWRQLLTVLVVFFPVLIWDHYLLSFPTGLWLMLWWLTLPTTTKLWSGRRQN
jgi:hypothetical protein